MRSCAGEMEREVNAILSPLGVESALSRRVAGALLSVEATLPPPQAPQSIFRQCLNAVARRPRFSNLESGTSNTSERSRLLPTASSSGGSSQARKEDGDDDEDEKGLTAFLLKFGEGLEETTDARLFISAITIGVSYFLGGLVPLLPYFFLNLALDALWWSIGITTFVLLVFGLFKTYFTGAAIGFTGTLRAPLVAVLRLVHVPRVLTLPFLASWDRLRLRRHLDPPRRWCGRRCFVRHRPRPRRQGSVDSCPLPSCTVLFFIRAST